MFTGGNVCFICCFPLDTNEKSSCSYWLCVSASSMEAHIWGTIRQRSKRMLLHDEIHILYCLLQYNRDHIPRCPASVALAGSKIRQQLLRSWGFVQQSQNLKHKTQGEVPSPSSSFYPNTPSKTKPSLPLSHINSDVSRILCICSMLYGTEHQG